VKAPNISVTAGPQNAARYEFGLRARSSRLIARAIFLTCLFLSMLPVANAQVAVTTYHNDNYRSGQNVNEVILTPSNVNQNSFGKLFSQSVDGAIYTQPLYLPNINIPGKGTHNVVFVATEHDSVFAFDADSNGGANALPLWQVSFINPAAGVTTVPSSDVLCTDISPEIGITGTPVIDSSTGTLYVVAKTLENSAYVQRLHALDVTSGAEKFGGPVVISGNVAGTGTGSVNGSISFEPQWQNQRLSLLLQNGLVYIGWGSHCSEGNGPFHGWIMAYAAGTLQQTVGALQQIGAWVDTPDGEQGGIWEGGGGPAGDAAFNTYFSTGSPATFDDATGIPLDYGESIVKLGPPSNGTFPVADFFTPFNWMTLSSSDLDISSSGLVLIDQPATSPHQHLLLSGGKQGTIYLLNRDNLGQFNPSSDTGVIQELPNALGGIFGTPAWWNGNIYIGGINDFLEEFALNPTTGLLSTSPTFETTTTFEFPSPTPSVSADGNANGIVWALQNDGFKTSGQTILHAYDATNISNEFYNTGQNPTRDAPGGAVKFTTPTIANGKVYVSTQTQVSVYGLLTNFSVNALPSLQSVTPGTSPTFTIQVSEFNGFNGIVNLSLAGLPTNATASFNPSSVTGTGQSVLTITTTATTPFGNYPLTITGTSGSANTIARVTLIVTAFPNSIQINSGGGVAGSFVADEFFSGGNSASVTATISTTGVTNPAPAAVYQSERWGVFTYTIPNLTPDGAYQVRLHFAELAFSSVGARVFNVAINGTAVLNNFDIIATAGAADTAVVEQFTATANSNGQITIAYTQGTANFPKSSGIEIIPLGSIPPDFSVSATPSTQTVAPAGAATYTVTVGALGGFSGVVGLAVSGLPANTTANFSATSVNGSGPSTLTVNTTSTTPGGTYPLTITGTSGSDTHTATVSLAVVVPGVIQINSGGPAVGSFVADEFFSGGSAASVTATINTSGVTNPAPAAVYQSERWGVFTYTVPNLVVGHVYTVRLHFAELAFSSVGARVFNVAINGTAVLSNFDIIATAGAADTAVVEQFTATANSSGQITIAYTQGTANFPKSSGIEILPQTASPDFSVSATPSSQSVAPGGGTTYTVTVGSIGGFNGAVALSVSGQPTGATLSFNPPTVTGSGPSTLTVSTTSSVANGTYPLTITGTSGTTTHTAPLSLIIQQAVATPTFSPGAGTYGAAQSVTINDTTSGASIFYTTNGTPPSTSSIPYNNVAIPVNSTETIEAIAVATGFSQSAAGSALYTILQPAATPTFSPVAGTYATAQNVTLSDTTSGASIFYTTDGTMPSTSSTLYNNVAIPVSSSETIRAIATATGFGQSAVGSAAYVISAPPSPDFSVSATPASQSVTTGASATYTVTIGSLNGFGGVVTPSLSGLPTGATPSFNPSTVTGSGTSTLTITTTTAMPSGTYPLIITGTSGSVTHTAGVSLTASAAATLQINSGGPAVGSFVADEFFSGGNSASVTATISTTGVTNPAPAAVYQSERWGVFTYTIPNLTPDGAYQVRLHFAELAFSSVGARVFNVAINGTAVLNNFDIIATAGAADTAVVEQFTATANSNGQITIAYTQGTANFPKSSGIEIIPLGSIASDFSVSATPSTQTVAPGVGTNYTVTVGALGGFSGVVGLAVSGLPANTTFNLSATSVNGSGPSTLTVNTTSTTPGGTYPLTITGTSGSVTHTATVTLAVVVPGVTQINSGGPTVGSFVADEFFSGGSAASVTTTINTSGVTNPAPAAVYQSERWGVFTYTVPNLVVGHVYTVRLHFAELAFSSVGARVFNVAINGTAVLNNFDIITTAGAADTAVVEQFTATANSSGQITIAYTQGTANFPKSSGIEILP
jgi:malectin (di-glucose binding ER protein)/chitobiase/beta-hexosaminidase-like protein